MKISSYLFAILFVLMSSYSFAQNRLPLDTIDVVKKKRPTPYKENHVTYGVILMGGYTSLVRDYPTSFGDERFKSKALLGGGLGFFYERPINRYIHLRPELYYTLSGYKALAELQTFRRYYHRINLPVYAKFYPWHFVHIYAGPQISYLAGSQDVNFNPDPTLINKYQRGNKNLNKLLFVLSVGAGVDINKRLAVNFTYSQDVSNSYNAVGFDSPYFRNQAINLRLDYRINVN